MSSLFQAKQTKFGLRQLYILLNQTLGANAFLELANAIWIDESNAIMQAYGKRETRKAQRYIQSEKFRTNFKKERQEEAEIEKFWRSLD